MDFHKRADGLKKMPREVSLQDTKKGVPLYSDLVNLKSNTMKNTLQNYDCLRKQPKLCLAFYTIAQHFLT